MSCDCTEAEAYTEQTRRARKAHVCGECFTAIPIGERYLHVSGIWDGEPDSHRFHVACDEARQTFGRLVREAQKAAKERVRLALRSFGTFVMAGTVPAPKSERPECAELRAAERECGALEYVCDCVPLGGLGEAMREYALEVLGYDTKTGKPPERRGFGGLYTEGAVL